MNIKKLLSIICVFLSPMVAVSSIYESAMQNSDTFNFPQLSDDAVIKLMPSKASETIKNLNDRQFQLWINENAKAVTDELLENRTAMHSPFVN